MNNIITKQPYNISISISNFNCTAYDYAPISYNQNKPEQTEQSVLLQKTS